VTTNLAQSISVSSLSCFHPSSESRDVV